MSQRGERRVALATGGTKGIRFEVALQLSANGSACGACGSRLGAGAIRSIIAGARDARVDLQRLDVSDDQSVRTAARRIASDFGKLGVFRLTWALMPINLPWKIANLPGVLDGFTASD
jgi:NAD(P)-dependent dehydrogenase (short-subunit alcohol dehydrogenase family)